MKRARYFSIFLLVLFWVFTLLAVVSCKKNDETPYIVTGVYSTNGGFGCRYEASAKGHPPISFVDECRKYKSGDVIFKVQ